MEETFNEQSTAVMTKPRKTVLAFLFSLLLPGFGQIYNGQLIKGIVFFVLIHSVTYIFALTRAATSLYGLIAWFVLEIALLIFIIYDGVKNARRQKQYILKPYNRWYYHLLFAIGMVSILIFLDISFYSLGIKNFKITGSGNKPTFQIGDRVVADEKAYNNKKPDYGDIVAFSRPDGKIWFFRIVGLPFDMIDLNDNNVCINGKPGKEKFISETKSDGVPVLEFEEELPNGHKYLIYKMKYPYDSSKANIKQIFVPHGSYYVMGDNRNRSLDSRHIGFIDEDSIIGRIIYTYWGDSFDRINIDFRNK